MVLKASTEARTPRGAPQPHMKPQLPPTINLEFLPPVQPITVLPLPLPWKPERGAAQSYERIREQARLQAKTIFGELQRRYPGRFADGQLRTLQRKVRQWRATDGPPKEVFVYLASPAYLAEHPVNQARRAAGKKTATQIWLWGQGKAPSLVSIATSDYPTPAARPLNSTLDCRRIGAVFALEQPDWRHSLSRVVTALEGVAA